MKEAAGEANLTVVAIILIGVVVAVATPLVNSLMQNAKYRSCCTDAGGVMEGSDCKIDGTTVSKTSTALKECMGGSSTQKNNG